MMQIANALIVDNSEVIFEAYKRKSRKLKRARRELARANATHSMHLERQAR